MMWYATLALLRCISPRRPRRPSTRLQGTQEEMARLAEEDRVDDGMGEELEINDQDPAARIEESALVEALLEKARSLHGPSRDPKLARLIKELEVLLKDGFRPVVFCRYIATATYLEEELHKHFSGYRVDAVTGMLTSEERAEKVALLSEEEKPILVATDCLSEGINLLDGFNAVIHYDLAWNPTRHEQREGRWTASARRQARCARSCSTARITRWTASSSTSSSARPRASRANWVSLFPCRTMTDACASPSSRQPS